jgi:hypothetical protein
MVEYPEQFKANQEEQAAQNPNANVQAMTERQVVAQKNHNLCK